MTSSSKIFVQAGFPLSIGGLIYILFRTDSLLMFRWLDMLGATAFIQSCRKYMIDRLNLPDWIIFSLPDALWVFSFTSLMLIIWHGKFSYNSIFWLLLAPIIGLFSELGQLVGIIPGTFDIIDLLLILLSAILPFGRLMTKQKICNA